MARNKLYKVKIKSSGNEIEVYLLTQGNNRGKYCNYNDGKSIYEKQDLIFLDNGR